MTGIIHEIAPFADFQLISAYTESTYDFGGFNEIYTVFNYGSYRFDSNIGDVDIVNHSMKTQGNWDTPKGQTIINLARSETTIVIGAHNDNSVYKHVIIEIVAATEMSSDGVEQLAKYSKGLTPNI